VGGKKKKGGGGGGGGGRGGARLSQHPAQCLRDQKHLWDRTHRGKKVGSCDMVRGGGFRALALLEGEGETDQLHWARRVTAGANRRREEQQTMHFALLWGLGPYLKRGRVRKARGYRKTEERLRARNRITKFI